jgi:putative ABC transport system substrate-binding protein
MNLKRRLYLYLACATMIVLPTLAASQSAPKIGLLAWSSCKGPPNEPGLDEFSEFVGGLRDLGYKPGDTVAIECQDAGGRYDGLEAAAAALVRLPVDIIVTTSQPAGRAAHRLTETIPIVTIVSGDPVAGGLARSLAKPGGNLTGVSYYATELTAKRLEFLKKLMPAITTVGVLANPQVSYLPFEADTKQAAAQLGLALKIQQVGEAADLESGFVQMRAAGAQAVFVLPDLMFAWESDRIAALALKYRLPCMAWGVWYVQEGCLMAYSADYGDMDRRLAFYVDRILKGAKPGDLPIEQPTRFTLSVNLKTAKALGLEVPRTVLLLADEVIE